MIFVHFLQLLQRHTLNQSRTSHSRGVGAYLRTVDGCAYHAVHGHAKLVAPYGASVPEST
eukprot:1744072-Rhodomonas_salina.3